MPDNVIGPTLALSVCPRFKAGGNVIVRLTTNLRVAIQVLVSTNSTAIGSVMVVVPSSCLNDSPNVALSVPLAVPAVISQHAILFVATFSINGFTISSSAISVLSDFLPGTGCRPLR